MNIRSIPLLLVLLAALLPFSGKAAFGRPTPLNLPPELLTMKAAAFVKLSAKELQRQSGSRLKMRERIAFTLLKKRLTKELRKNPDLTVGQYMLTAEKRKNDWLILILALLLMGLLLFIAAAVNFGQ